MPTGRVGIGVVLALSLAAGSTRAQEEAAPLVVADGRRVSIEFTLTLSDGSVHDSNVGGEPLVYEQGGHQILPALEAQLAGLAVGDTTRVSLTAAEAYGEVDPELFRTVPASAIPESARRVGYELIARSPSGRPHWVRVRELKGDEIVVDHNHPLAGKDLTFDVKILAIE